MSSTISSLRSLSAAVSFLASLAAKIHVLDPLDLRGRTLEAELRGIGIDIGGGPLHDAEVLLRGGALRGGRFGCGGDLRTGQRALVLHHALGVARAALGGRGVDRHNGRNRALDDLRAVLQTALDDQRALTDFENLLA